MEGPGVVWNEKGYTKTHFVKQKCKFYLLFVRSKRVRTLVALLRSLSNKYS